MFTHLVFAYCKKGMLLSSGRHSEPLPDKEHSTRSPPPHPAFCPAPAVSIGSAPPSGGRGQQLGTGGDSGVAASGLAGGSGGSQELGQQGSRMLHLCFLLPPRELRRPLRLFSLWLPHLSNTCRGLARLMRGINNH